MSVIWTEGGLFKRVDYKGESDLEAAIIEVQEALFGSERIYLDVKKKIGAKGKKGNIPDGYLIDLSSNKPKLFVVENELARHEPLKHIAVQILEFSLSFNSEKYKVKNILFDALKEQPAIKHKCEQYAVVQGFNSLDHLLESLVFDNAFTALVIIDEMPDDLQNVLSNSLSFGVEVLELARYENDKRGYIYRFEPFLSDLTPDIAVGSGLTSKKTPLVEFDTVVVPAKEDGFKEVFLGQDRWYAVRIHGAMRPQIKYIAAYQVAPTSAITHIAPVKSIEQWADTDKVVINFSESAKEIGPIKLVNKGQVKALQNLRYANREKLESARTLDDVWS